ncbi:MAG: HIT family protein, partial [Actinomycetota bacterium]
MERLWSPWRMQYVTAARTSGECIFCHAFAEARGEPLYRSELSVVMLNAYPYNTGHLMVAPGRHTGALDDLSAEERHDLMDVVSIATRVLDEAMNPNGFNLGMNLGSVAGAGVPDHLHIHIV